MFLIKQIIAEIFIFFLDIWLEHCDSLKIDFFSV